MRICGAGVWGRPRRQEPDMAQSLWWYRHGRKVIDLALLAAFLVAALLILLSGGCAGRVTGGLLSEDIIEAERNPDGTVALDAQGRAVMARRKRRAEGPTVRGGNPETVALPPLTLDGISSGGGGLTMFRLGKRLTVPIIMAIGGVVLVAAGALLAKFAGIRVGAAAVLAGLTVCLTAAGVERYPWLAALAVLAVIAAGLYVAYRLRHGEAAQEALGAIVPAVEDSPNAESIKDRVAAEAGRAIDRIRAEVRRTKQRLGIRE
jgi:hypothetical protein